MFFLDIDANFLSCVKNMATHLLSADNIQPKVVEGVSITSGELFTYLTDFVKEWNVNGNLNNIRSPGEVWILNKRKLSVI